MNKKILLATIALLLISSLVIPSCAQPAPAPAPGATHRGSSHSLCRYSGYKSGFGKCHPTHGSHPLPGSARRQCQR